jgi:hypothetical protein
MIRPYVESFEYVEHGRSVRLFGDVELPGSAHCCLYSHIPGGAPVIPPPFTTPTLPQTN